MKTKLIEKIEIAYTLARMNDTNDETHKRVWALCQLLLKIRKLKAVDAVKLANECGFTL